MPASGVAFAEASQDVELLEESLGDCGELRTATHAVQVLHDLAVRAAHGFSTRTRDEIVELLELPEKLFPVEVRQSPTPVRIHGTPFRRASITTLDQENEACQGGLRLRGS
jgi:hypothetical protein